MKEKSDNVLGGVGLLEDLRCDGLEGAPVRRCAERMFLAEGTASAKALW